MGNSETFAITDQAPVNHGRRSDIFKLSNECILKLYSPDFPEAKVEQEFTNAVMVYQQTDITTPQPLELVTQHGRKGIIFQAVEGQSFMDIFQANPVKYFTWAKKLAMIQDNISLNTVSGIPTQQQSFSALLSDSERLSQSQKKELLKILNIKSSNKLCHGDFHHGNVIHTLDNVDYVIDWMDAFAGEPLLDIALTAVNAAVSDAPAHVPLFYRNLYEILKKVMALDARIISLHAQIDQAKLTQHLALAAGIHLARFEGENDQAHKRYFLHTMSNLN